MNNEQIMVRATHLLIEKKQFVQELSFCIGEIESLRTLDFHAIQFGLWQKRVMNLLIHGFGEFCSQVKEFREISFYDEYADQESKNPWSAADFDYDAVGNYQSGLNKAQTQLMSIKEEVGKYFNENKEKDGLKINSQRIEGVNKKIFIVHGHDDLLRVKVVDVVKRLGLEPIVLRDKPNKGRTIIEKFEENADVGFTIVLLSADDKGYDKNNPNEISDRARQNVVLELGYFIGKYGRDRVMVLCAPSVERPGDIAGVVYTDATNEYSWSLELVKELNAVGFKVDANKLLEL